MRLFITGGAGFIGSTFVRHLLADGYPGLAGATATVLDKLTYSGNRANLPTDPRLRFVHGDVTDPDLLGQMVPGHDAVLHFATESHVDRSIAAADDFVRTNVLGTQRLLDAARAATVGRFLQISTDEVYGSIPAGAWAEDRALAPNSPYAASKAGADLLVRAATRTHGLDTVITRCTNNYGPRQHPEKLVPRFITRLLLGQRVPLYGDGQQVRDWLHVDDHCRGIALALTGGRAGEIYHLGGGTPLTNRALTDRLLALCGADSGSIEWVADRPGHDRRYALDHTKASTELGYHPRIEFTAGLAATVDWYRDHPDWWRPLLPA